MNKYPAFVGYMVRRLKLLYPALGKEKIAQLLARAGLHLGVSTVGWVLKRPTRREAEDLLTESGRRLKARRPNAIWHVDLTTVPCRTGSWVPWMPHSLHQRWPFAWWIVVVVDHASRYLVAVTVFKRRPTTAQVCSFLEGAMRRLEVTPRTVITDKGMEFRSMFRAWCRGHGISHRCGSVGEHGSIAIVERFIRSMKCECIGRPLGLLGLEDMRRELTLYGRWYNRHRPHSALGGRTPEEVYLGKPPANSWSRFEPRPR